MLKLTPISKGKYDSIVLEGRLQELIEALPTPTNGTNGRDGAKGKDGSVTTVTREVLANKEKLLGKEEFEEFKAMMLKTEQDIRDSLARTSNYFPGGGTQDRLVIKSEDYSARTSDIVICTNTSTIEVTLPSAKINERVNIKRRGVLVTVLGSIDGVTNKDINVLNYSMRLVYNGTEWNEI